MQLAAALLAVGAATSILRWTATTNPTTVALAYLIVVLFVAAGGTLGVALATSAAGMLCFNYFFLPPVGTFTIADAHNWVALVAFVAVSAVASQLAASARARTREAEDRRKELTRLFDLTRDVLLTTDAEADAVRTALASHVARRFELETAVICIPRPHGGWHRYPPAAPVAVEDADLDTAFASARGVLEFDARSRAYGGQLTRELPSGASLSIAPVRLGMRVSGLLVVAGRHLEPGTLDAVAGIVAIAIERGDFLAERHTAELARQRAELSSALLASLSHDLRTPLTAIQTAVSNIADRAIGETQREEQGRVALEQLARLSRLFEEILDMARIESHTVRPVRDWVTPADIIEAAVAHTGDALDRHTLQIDAASDVVVETDPRLTSAALAHLLENAAVYAPAGTVIEARGWTDEEGLRLTVRDHGPGLDPAELANLFEPFYRGRRATATVPGTGMGLAITRGLLAVEAGRVWAENVAPNGALFTIVVPARVRAVEPILEA